MLQEMKGVGIVTVLFITMMLGSLQVNAYSEGDWLVRGRIINVSPNDSSGEVAGIAGTGVSVDDATTVEVDFTYMLSSHLGLELILATSKHDIAGNKGALDGVAVAEVNVLPPTLTLQYHYTPTGSMRPYAGIGLNYTMFYGEDSKLSGTGIELDDSIGLAVQLGIDMDINDTWFFNADIKYISIDTTANLTGGTVGSVEVDINPIVIGLGIGTKF